jgi:hypothetical protein
LLAWSACLTAQKTRCSRHVYSPIVIVSHANQPSLRQLSPASFHSSNSFVQVT